MCIKKKPLHWSGLNISMMAGRGYAGLELFYNPIHLLNYLFSLLDRVYLMGHRRFQVPTFLYVTEQVGSNQQNLAVL